LAGFCWPLYRSFSFIDRWLSFLPSSLLGHLCRRVFPPFPRVSGPFNVFSVAQRFFTICHLFFPSWISDFSVLFSFYGSGLATEPRNWKSSVLIWLLDPSEIADECDFRFEGFFFFVQSIFTSFYPRVSSSQSPRLTLLEGSTPRPPGFAFSASPSKASQHL